MTVPPLGKSYVQFSGNQRSMGDAAMRSLITTVPPLDHDWRQTIHAIIWNDWTWTILSLQSQIPSPKRSIILRL